MTAGIGTDIVEVDRIAASLGKEQGFREMVFSPLEIAYCEAKTHKYEHYAARFAAKEAFFKAIGTGWKNGTSFNEIEIYNEVSGKPHIRLLGATAATLSELTPEKIQVSLSHTVSMAIAVVMVGRFSL
ncbi:MAG: holo-ACP synthase [Sphingobacteriales bacterium]|nr:holo-ACP synthase [Sphingobacteriales bacterium]OJY90215.1 MAG: holo-[acyl-carrier-protein] synthase [Sphingobacteriales bacterium 44-15]